MRKIIFLMHVSLDGFVAGPSGEMDWIIHEGEVANDAYSLHSSTDAAIYGRVTYDMMAGYWPHVLTNPESSPAEMAHAQWADNATKYVISRTLKNPEWRNTVVISENIADEMRQIKAQEGKHIWLLGSPSVAQIFMQHDLIDEYRLNVNPVILGQGIPLFGKGMAEKLDLRLLEARTFKEGVVGLRYMPANRG